MPAETKSKGAKLETRVAPSLKKKFAAHCKRHGLSVAQHLRDLVQRDLKKV